MCKFKIINPRHCFYYSPSIRGTFFTIGKNGRVGEECDCREVFSYYFTKNTYAVGFRSGLNTFNAIKTFFNKIENKLKLKKKSVVKQSTEDNIVVVIPSPFWKTNSVNKQMFSLFLRCAGAYFIRRRKIDSAINAYNLSRRIKYAISRFLDGNTKLVNITIGSYNLVEVFSRYSNKEIDAIFVKP